MRSIAVVVYDVCGKNIDGNRNDANSVCRNLSKIPEQRKIICPAGQRTSQNAMRFNLWLKALVEFRGKLKYPDHNKWFCPSKTPPDSTYG